MKDKFNMYDFNCWVQDTQDYSLIDDKSVYVTRKSSDAINYCIEVLGMIVIDAWMVGNSVYVSESKRLNLF